MFRFEHPEFLWIGILVPLLLAMYFVRRYLLGRDRAKWGETSFLPTSNDKAYAGPRWLWLGLMSLMLLVFAAANPQSGLKTTRVESKSADIYLLLDISTSMLAGDVAPNRLDRAKKIAVDLSETFKQDRVGLILFAGNAYVQSPLTTDRHAVQMFINAANPDQAGTQGTAIGEAIRLLLRQDDDGSEHKGAIIVLTDGEDHDSDAEAAVNEAREAGWTTYIIGIGTTEGSTIPMSYNGMSDVKRDESGKPVITSLNAPLMTSLASKGGGAFYDATKETNLTGAITSALSGLERTQTAERSFSEYKSYYQVFLLPAILFLCAIAVLNFKYELI